MNRGSEAANRPTDRREQAQTNDLAGAPESPPDASDSRRVVVATDTPPGRATGVLMSQVRQQLSDRDQAVLWSLANLRLMTTRQIERLHFREGSRLTQARRCRHTLERLHRFDLTHRLSRRVGGIHAGSSSFVYSLSSRGRRLLGLDGPAGGRRRRPNEPSVAFQDHVLAITELCVQLHDDARGGRFELLGFEPEPACWRRYSGVGGERLILKPDAFVVIADGEFEILNFVEVDLGTEGRTTLRRKGDTYLDYATSGTEQLRSGVFPRVVFLVPDEARAGVVVSALRGVRRGDELFVVGTLERAATVLSGSDS